MKERLTTSYPDKGTLNSSALPIIDQFDRSFNYLRLALNEQCNLRCIYCMPTEGVAFRTKDKLLTREEIFRIIKIFSKMGVSKIRFTGGEPLLRRDLPRLIRFAGTINGIESVYLTTNGLLLSMYIDQLVAAGIDGINISIDTLIPAKYKAITRQDGLDLVLKGLKKAIQSPIQTIKVNVVVMREFNDDELLDFVALTKNYDITIRFIELMPFDSHQIWKTGKFYSADRIVFDLTNQILNIEKVSGTQTEHHIFRVDGYKGKVAVIPAYSRSLCSECNRIRITSDGKLLNCLYSQEETNIRDAMRNGKTDEEIGNMIQNSMWKKFINGWETQRHGKDHRESMTQIGG